MRLPAAGEYRVFNQFDEVYSIGDIADRVVTIARECGLDASIRHVDNPRVEMAEHHYNPDRQRLLDIGYVPYYCIFLPEHAPQDGKSTPAEASAQANTAICEAKDSF